MDLEMDNQKLNVKALAGELGRSVHFVYQMRAAGFRMWQGEASIREAKRWIRVNRFVVLHGRGMVVGHKKRGSG